MIRFSEIWDWIVVVVVVIFAASITILAAQTNDAPISKETNLSDDANEVDDTTKVELQPKTPTSLDTMVGIDPFVAVEIRHLFNELERERLSNRSGYIDKWLAVVAIVLTFFAVVIAVLGIVGYRRFRELEADAKNHVEEIKANLAKSEEHLGQMSSIDLGDPEKTVEVEKAVQDVQSDPEPSFIDKILTEIYTLQRNGRVEDVVEKWRSIANIAEGIDNDLASRAWLSIAYLLPKRDNRLDAYDKAMNLNPNYTRPSRDQSMSEYSRQFHEGIVVGAVLRYFSDSKFEKFSTVREHSIRSGPYMVDVALLDERGRFVAIAECKNIGYVERSGIAQLTEYCRRSDAQFGILAADTNPSKWTFFKGHEGEFTEIDLSQFEEEVVGSESS